jgi:hypothetical protein
MSDAILSSGSLVDQARLVAGLHDFGEDTWQEGPERLLEFLRGEARLHRDPLKVLASVASLSESGPACRATRPTSASRACR